MVRGKSVTKGYLDMPEENKRVFANGWFHTGDVGHLEKGKFLVITDRKKEIFKLSSGKFVAPQLIENKIKESAFVDQVMVVGEHQKFASALLVPDFNYLKEWMTENNVVNGKTRAELISMPEISSVFQEEIKKINRGLQDWERINRIRLVADEWSPATGELSASLKLKRKVVNEKYIDLINEMY